MNPKTSTVKTQEHRFSAEADEALEKFYDSVGATEPQQKMNLLKVQLGDAHYYAYGGHVSDDLILGALETEYLRRRGLIKLKLA